MLMLMSAFETGQTSVLSQQQTSVLSQQQTSVLSQQKTPGCFGSILRGTKMTSFYKSGHIGFQRVSVGTLMWHNRTRRGSTDRSTVPYCGARLVYGPTWRPHGPSGAPSGPDGPRRHRRTPFNRSLPSLGGPQLLLAQPMLLV